MKRSILAAAALAFVAFASTAAFAKTASGTIQSIDRNGDSITLSDGKTFTLPEGIEAETLKPGEKVVVTYKTTKSGKLEASNVHLAQ
jgi:uncharacterized cupredoxin-like copper-binding protein